jgi:hypothetical protein
MLQISDGKQARIVKYGGGQLERNTMLSGIGIRLSLIPLELKRARTHRTASHTMLSQATQLESAPVKQ